MAKGEVNVDPITMDERLLTLRSLKETPGRDDTNIELMRKALPSYLLKVLEFLDTCWKTGSIPDECKEAVMCLILKKATERIL
jgi:hypothetical protein